MSDLPRAFPLDYSERRRGDISKSSPSGQTTGTGGTEEQLRTQLIRLQYENQALHSQVEQLQARALEEARSEKTSIIEFDSDHPKFTLKPATDSQDTFEDLARKLAIQVGKNRSLEKRIRNDEEFIHRLEGDIDNLELEREALQLKINQKKKTKSPDTSNDKRDSSENDSQRPKPRRGRETAEVDALMQINAELLDQIYRLQTELAEVKGGEVQVDEETWGWLGRARDENLGLEDDLGHIEESLHYHPTLRNHQHQAENAGPTVDNSSSGFPSAVPIEHALNLDKQATHDDESRPQSIPAESQSSLSEQRAPYRYESRPYSPWSYLSSAIDDPTNLGDLADMLNLGLSGSRPQSVTWGHIQGFSGSRTGSIYGYSTPYLRSFPNSRSASQTGFTSSRIGRHGRGTDAPPRSPTQKSSIQSSSDAVPLLSEKKRAAKADEENFYTLLPHNKEAEAPKFSPELKSPPGPAKYSPGMNALIFDRSTRRSSIASLRFAHEEGMKPIEEAHAYLRPLHLGRRSSLGTIAEGLIDSEFGSPRIQKLTHLASWNSEVQAALSGAILMSVGTQTDAAEPAGNPENIEKGTQTMTEDPITSTLKPRLTVPSDMAELPAGVPVVSSSIGSRVALRPTKNKSPSRVTGSRVAATARLFDREDAQINTSRTKLAIDASVDAQKTPVKKRIEETTPTMLFKNSRHLPFVRNEALTKSMQAVLTPKTKDGDFLALKPVQPKTITAPAVKDDGNEILPALAYQDDPRPPSKRSSTVGASVQTLPLAAEQTVATTASPIPSIRRSSVATSDTLSFSQDVSAVTWYSPDDVSYPTPRFYADTWRSSVASYPSGLELANVSLSSHFVNAPTCNQESTMVSIGLSSINDQAGNETAEDFARTTSPSPEDKEAELWPEDQSETLPEYEEEHGSHQQENQPSNVASGNTYAIPGFNGEADEQTSSATFVQSSAMLKPMAAGVLEEKTVNASPPKPSDSPVSPENMSDHRLATYDNRKYLPSAEPSSKAPPVIMTELRVELETVQASNKADEKFSLTTIVSPHSDAPMLVDTTVIPFPRFEDQDNEVAAQYAGAVVMSPQTYRSSDPFHLDTPSSPVPGSSYRHLKQFRAQALAALEGTDWQMDSPGIEATAFPRPLTINDSMRSMRRAARPAALNFERIRFRKPESEAAHPPENGTTSPNREEHSIIGTPQQYFRRRATAGRDMTTATMGAPPTAPLLLEWHKSASAAPQSIDRGRETSVFPGVFDQRGTMTESNGSAVATRTGRYMQLLNIITSACGVDLHLKMDFSMKKVLCYANLVYLISVLWMMVILRDQIDEWKSANVSRRKVTYVMGSRDEHWGNSWWSLLEWVLAGGLHELLGGSTELFV